jgi:hypothetical protein
VVKNNLNPAWGDATVELGTLCDGDFDKPIQIVVFDYESNGKHVIMGQFETSVNGLINSATGGSDDMSKAIKLRYKGKESGTIMVLKAEVAGVEDVTTKMAGASIDSRVAAPAPSAPVYTAAAPLAVTAAYTTSAGQPSFVDYISGGCELQVFVAIDFTGSNGDPRKPGTLHYIHPDGSKNDYEKAISAIVNILAKYDTDKKFPVFGFGAKYGGVVRHCFQCGPTEEANGVQGVLDAYRAVFQSGLVMSGPTVFTEVIEVAAARAISSQVLAPLLIGNGFAMIVALYLTFSFIFVSGRCQAEGCPGLYHSLNSYGRKCERCTRHSCHYRSSQRCTNVDCDCWTGQCRL